jgi:hypothetical protein
MDEMDMRNGILADIIDKMHSRMADKMFPPDPAKMDEPAVMAVPSEAGKAETAVEDSEDVDNEPSEEDLDEMMKSL